MTSSHSFKLTEALDARFNDAPRVEGQYADNGLLQSMASRGSVRAFSDAPVEVDLLNVLSAVALASPTKSDLQQRDIVFLQDPALRGQLADLVSGQSWVAGAPMVAIFCGNNRRQRLLHDWKAVPFANDHLDAFLNAAADAAIALGAFVTAAEAVGLGCCPISAVRNEARAVSELLALPEHVFPFAGLAIGYPAASPEIAKRLPLGVTCHVDQYLEHNLQAAIETYDAEREAAQPYSKQRFPEVFGENPNYGWSEDKVRQYSQPERADFGTFVKAKGFQLK